MAQASRVGVDTVGGGLVLGAGNLLVSIDAANWTVVGDAIASHGVGAHAAATMIQGSSLVAIDGTPACIAGNVASCGDTTTGGGLVGAAA